MPRRRRRTGARRQEQGVPPSRFACSRSRTTSDSASVDNNTSTSESTNDTASVTMLVPNIHLTGHLGLEEEREHGQRAEQEAQHAKALHVLGEGDPALEPGELALHQRGAAIGRGVELADHLGKREEAVGVGEQQQRDRREEQGGGGEVHGCGRVRGRPPLPHTARSRLASLPHIATRVAPSATSRSAEVFRRSDASRDCSVITCCGGTARPPCTAPR